MPAIKMDVGYSFFQSEKEIKRSLYPFAPHVHKIHAVDGRYQYYEGGPLGDFSNDDSVRLIEALPNASVYYYTGLQFKKRQVYFDAATDADFLFVLDTDEYIHPDYMDWDRFYEDLEKCSNEYPNMDIFSIKIYFHHNYEKAFNVVELGGWQSYMRIIRNPSTIEYDLTHYTYVKKGDKKHNWLTGPHQREVEGIRLATDSIFRQDIIKERDKWAWDNMQHEKQLIYEATLRGEMR
jgi:hypothetical protein